MVISATVDRGRRRFLTKAMAAAGAAALGPLVVTGRTIAQTRTMYVNTWGGSWTAAEEAGRDPDALRRIVRGVTQLGADVRTDDGGRRLLCGSAEQIRDDLGRLGDAGVTEVFLDPTRRRVGR